MPRRTLEQLLDDACRRIERLEPLEAARAAGSGALLVDIRAQDARERDGVIPGALHVPRTVLEWRVDPEGAWRNPALRPGSRLILVCDHGYSSILAAATLAELGFEAADVVGGFEAWKAAGLPVSSAPPRRDGLPGLGPHD
jgi:rhodanese-related sulfurtransferase